MGLSDIVGRLDKYQKRLSKGSADKIKPHHIQKAIEKLTVKQAALSEELAGTTKPEKRERLENKIAVISEQIERARWLEKEI